MVKDIKINCYKINQKGDSLVQSDSKLKTINGSNMQFGSKYKQIEQYLIEVD